MAAPRPWRGIILEPPRQRIAARVRAKDRLNANVTSDRKAMKLYSSFLIRWWLTREGSHSERTVLQVEHIQTGASTRAASLTEADKWMRETSRNTKTAMEEGAMSNIRAPKSV